jgi:glycosyltransferase involved in cell wall biosynthesis
MTTGMSYTLPHDSLNSHSVHSGSNISSLHVLTLTPFFPSRSNPVYGTYVSEPIQLFGHFNLHSTVFGVSPLYRGQRHALSDAGIEWIRYPQIPGNLGLATAGTFLYRRLSSRVRQLHQQRPIDIIHAHAALPCGHAAFLLAESIAVPFVVTVHGLDVFNSCFKPETAAAKHRIRLSAEVYRRAGSVICISRVIQNILKEGMQQLVSSSLIYNGTDAQTFSPDESRMQEEVPTILMVGNLLRGKGHEVVLKAMAPLTERFPGLRCKIIGEGSDQKRFADLASDLAISQRVSFMGRQGRDSVAKAMRECTIFALPSRFEGLGCAYLEAMACAKPVIACEGQGIGEIIRHGQNGWLIPVDGVTEMAEALSQLLSSSDLRTRIGASARNTILDGLSMKDQVRQLEQVYRHVAGR